MQHYLNAHNTKSTALLGMAPSSNSPEAKVMVLLYNGYSASKDFFDEVKHLVTQAIPGLQPNASYTTEMLCGQAFWVDLHKSKRILAGRCLAHMVVTKQLPLRFSDRFHCSKRYQPM